MSSTEVEVVGQGAQLIAQQPGWPQDKIDLVKATVAKGASDNELQMFLALADKYQLDPFAKEIWCIKDEKGNIRIQAARDGFLAIANRHPQYDGMTADVVWTADTFERTRDGVNHTYNLQDRQGQIAGAYALVYRKDRSIPTFFFARKSEYTPKGTIPAWSPWSKFPSAMILKVAEANALKRAFSLSGLEAEDDSAVAADGPRPSYEQHQQIIGGRAAPTLAGTGEESPPAADGEPADGEQIKFGEPEPITAEVVE